jgi:peptide/nickel transport system substrate-binding protein
VPFETLIGSPILWIMPREVVEADGDATKRVIGSGPFIFDKLESGISFTGHKNPDYYRAGEPHVDQVVGLIIPDTATQLAALRSGQLDFYQLLSQTDIEPHKQTNPELQFVEWEWLYTPFIDWKVDQAPFNDARVRQAVAMALSRSSAQRAGLLSSFRFRSRRGDGAQSLVGSGLSSELRPIVTTDSNQTPPRA